MAGLLIAGLFIPFAGMAGVSGRIAYRSSRILRSSVGAWVSLTQLGSFSFWHSTICTIFTYCWVFPRLGAFCRDRLTCAVG